MQTVSECRDSLLNHIISAAKILQHDGQNKVYMLDLKREMSNKIASNSISVC